MKINIIILCMNYNKKRYHSDESHSLYCEFLKSFNVTREHFWKRCALSIKNTQQRLSEFEKFVTDKLKKPKKIYETRQTWSI